MQLEKFPRGREHARAIDADPVPEPQGPGHEYTDGNPRIAEVEAERKREARRERVAVPVAHDVAPVATPPTMAAAPPTTIPERTAHSPAVHTPAPEAPAQADWKGWKVKDESGKNVGKVESAEHPEWLVVRDRRGRQMLAPSAQAIGGEGSVFLPYEADQITSAPRLDGADAPDEAVADAARAHYG